MAIGSNMCQVGVKQRPASSHSDKRSVDTGVCVPHFCTVNFVVINYDEAMGSMLF